MPVYQDRGPGIGEGLTNAFANFISMRRQKKFDALAQENQGLDNQLKKLQIATTYPTVSPDGGETPAIAPVKGPTFTPDDFEASLRQSFGAAPGSVAPSTFNQQGNQHAAPIPATDPGALFQQNMERSFSQNPTGRAGAGAMNIPGNPNASATTSGGSIVDRLPTNKINVPGYGTVDQWGGLKRQLLIKELETQLGTNAKIAEAYGTGAAQKNFREVQKPQLGDDNYASLMGDVAGSEARARNGAQFDFEKAMTPVLADRAYQSKLATLPLEIQQKVAEGKISLDNALAEIGARGRVELGLQTNQQNFTRGENALNRTNQRDMQGRELAGSFVNQSALEHQRASNGIIAPHTAAPASTVAPSEAIAPSAVLDPRSKAIDAMLRSGMSADEIKAALGKQP